ncbi:MAG: outer membrane protein assembly factor BamA, partial [Opitutales bacterium]|nr:outer membrane protein assembly factor BamA [Opitutales bacterium]
ILAAAAPLFVSGLAWAQSPMEIDKIKIVVEGPQQVSREAVSAHLKVRSGEPFNQGALDLSVRSLYDTGLYDSVDVKRLLKPDGKLDLEFLIKAKFRISQLAFKGNASYSADRLREEIASYSGGVLDDRLAHRDAEKIAKFYRKKGYAFVKVKPEILKNEELGTGALVFNIDEGADIKIQNIRFVGNNNLDEETLRDAMKTTTWRWLISYILDWGRYKDDEFYDDLNSLRKVYRDHGYLDVKIDDADVKYIFPDKDNPGDLDIEIKVDEGRQYKVGKIEFKNNKLASSETLMKGMDILEGDVFSPSKVDSSVEWIKEYYGYFGYLDTVVRALRRPNLQTGDIDLVLEIFEGDQFYLESISIQGNTKTKSEVILRELALAPGELFYADKMKISENMLRTTRFFDEVNLSSEATNIPNRRNLRVIVKEGRTGNFVFGAGFSTVESFVATAEVSQSNFDLFNYHNGFQGAGQKFRIRGSAGLKSNQIRLSFENPWIFNRRIAYGFDLYRTDTGYYSDYYSEVRTGFSQFIRKHLFELVEGRLGYTVENVEIYDVKSNAPQVIKNETGNRSISEISLSFLRDDRDDYMMPTSGTRFEILQQVAGGPLMGQTNLYRVEGRGGVWIPMSKYFGHIPVFKYGNQVFSIVGRTGSVTGYGGKEVPFFEKYFLGGPYNLRGFKYRKVGPIDPATREPEGGNTFGYLSLEYSYQIIEQLRVALFYDIGFLNADSWDWDPSEYNDDIGIGFRIVLMGAPMRIDLGLPLTTGDFNKDGLQFNFSFGTVF